MLNHKNTKNHNSNNHNSSTKNSKSSDSNSKITVIVAFWATFRGFGPLFGILLGS